jgi:hypothetical protein
VGLELAMTAMTVAKLMEARGKEEGVKGMVVAMMPLGSVLVTVAVEVDSLQLAILICGRTISGRS